MAQWLVAVVAVASVHLLLEKKTNCTHIALVNENGARSFFESAIGLSVSLSRKSYALHAFQCATYSKLARNHQTNNKNRNNDYIICEEQFSAGV